MSNNTNTSKTNFFLCGRGLGSGRIDGVSDFEACKWADIQFPETGFPSCDSYKFNLHDRYKERPDYSKDEEPADVFTMQKWFKENWQEDYDISMEERSSTALPGFRWRRTSRGWAILRECPWAAVRECDWELMEVTTPTPQV